MTEKDREYKWFFIIELIQSTTPTLNDRAILLQSAIADLGPIPDSLGEKVRELLRTPNAGAADKLPDVLTDAQARSYLQSMFGATVREDASSINRVRNATRNTHIRRMMPRPGSYPPN